MAEYLSPGVYVEEIDRGPKPIEGVGTAMACFVGFTEKAQLAERIDGETITHDLLNRPQLVTNWSQYVERFGGFADGAYLPQAIYGYFQNGGSRCYVVSVKTIPKAQVALLNGEVNPQLIVKAKQARFDCLRMRVKGKGPQSAAPAEKNTKGKHRAAGKAPAASSTAAAGPNSASKLGINASNNDTTVRAATLDLTGVGTVTAKATTTAANTKDSLSSVNVEQSGNVVGVKTRQAQVALQGAGVVHDPIGCGAAHRGASPAGPGTRRRWPGFWAAGPVWCLRPFLLSTPARFGRAPGWLAHVLEQYADNRIIRPRAEYIGHMLTEYVPIERRAVAEARP